MSTETATTEDTEDTEDTQGQPSSSSGLRLCVLSVLRGGEFCTDRLQCAHERGGPLSTPDHWRQPGTRRQICPAINRRDCQIQLRPFASTGEGDPNRMKERLSFL